MSERNDGIDALRGYALIAIFVDHVPHSILTLGSPISFAFSDAAELFFFVSGFVGARVYLPVLRNAGLAAAAAKIWRRGWSIYVAQIVLFIALAAEVSAIVATTGRSSYLDMFRLKEFFQQTDAAVIQLLLLRYQPAYLDVLPVYIVLFAALPFVLYAVARNVWFALISSFAIYCAVQASGPTPLTYPWNAPWMFNPLAWQFIFMVGVAAGSRTPRPGALVSRHVVAVACILALFVGAVQECGALHVYFPFIPLPRLSWLPIDKAGEGWIRLVNFLALAIVVERLAPALSRWRTTLLWRALACCGRNSLATFFLGALLAAMGCVTWVEAGNSTPVQLVFCLAGIGVLVAIARALDAMRNLERTGTVRRYATPSPA